jgi:copper chaperone CopZ
MKKKLIVEGMSCNHCINHLTTALQEDVEGVDVLEVDLGYAVVDMNEDVSNESLREVIEDLGFELVEIK